MTTLTYKAAIDRAKAEAQLILQAVGQYEHGLNDSITTVALIERCTAELVSIMAGDVSTSPTAHCDNCRHRRDQHQAGGPCYGIDEYTDDCLCTSFEPEAPLNTVLNIIFDGEEVDE